MKTPPACQWYFADFIEATAHFTDAEVGLYMRLLAAQWRIGSLPNDETELQSYGKGRTPLKRILAKFTLGEDGRLRNERMEQERAKQEAFRIERAESGKRGAQRKWHGSAINSANGSAIKEPIAEPMATTMANDGSSVFSLQSSVQSEPVPVSTTEGSRAQNSDFERPSLEEFTKFMVEHAGISKAYAADRWGRYDSVDWIATNGRPIAKWRSLAPSLQTQFRNDQAEHPPTNGSEPKPPPDPAKLAAKMEAWQRFLDNHQHKEAAAKFKTKPYEVCPEFLRMEFLSSPEYAEVKAK